MQIWVVLIVAINFSIFALANDNAFQNIEYDLFNNQPKTQTEHLLFESPISSDTQFLCNSNQAIENEQSDCSVQSFSESDENQTHLRLLDWLRKGNGYLDKIEIEEYSQDNRGVNAKQDIEANEIILLIPKTHLITLEMAKQTPIAQKLIEKNINLLSPKHSYMAIFLLQEKQKLNSFWKPYINILPKAYSNFPIFYSKNELEWLKDSRFLEQIKTRIQDLKKDYETICKIAPEFRANSFQDFCWARTSTCSRIFTITIGGVTTDSFVPVADMLNHEISASTTWSYSDKKNGFIVKAMSKIGQGQSISDSYGLKSNSRFLLNYGFTITKNNANDIDLIIYPNLNDNLHYIKEKLTKEKIGLTKTFKVVMQIEEKKVQEFMSYIRFIIINREDQLYQILNKQGQQYIKRTEINFISISNELQMWIKIGQICKTQLDQYPTTYEQDQVIFENQELTINQRNCLILRMGEKEILRFYIIFSQKMSLLLNHFNLNEIHQFLQQDKNYQYKKYIKSILIVTKQNFHYKSKFRAFIKIVFIQSKFKCIEVFLSKRYITYSTFPIFYDESELKWLEGSFFLEHIDNKMTEHKQDYDEIYQAVPEFRVYSFQDFCWAKISTCSRIYEVTINETDTFAYIPLADMINHVNPPETNWFYSDEQEGFILQADERIQKGKQVFDSYGAKSNLILLLNYGFVEDNNGANEIDVKVFPSIDDRLLQLKQDLTYENLKTTKFFKLLFDTENFEVQEFMSYIRFITIKNEDQLYQILNKQGQQYIKITQINFISIKNELEMWVKIGQICKKQLDQYPTTYEQDQVILENQKLTINQRNCLILRMGEKEILRFYIIFSQKMSLLLNQFNLNEIHQFISQDKNYQYKKYIKSILMYLFEI